MSRDDVLQGNDITRLAIPLQASADFQSQLLGQCAFAIGQHSVGGAVLCHGADVKIVQSPDSKVLVAAIRCGDAYVRGCNV